MIKFLDLHRINNRFRDDFEAAFRLSLDSSQFILGHNVLKFESEFAQYCGTKYCVGTANGMEALTLILKGYIHLGRLKKGDKVIVPANTFIATILSILHAELQPVFVEPHADTFNLSTMEASLAFNNDVKAIIMVHLYGQLADVGGLQRLAKEYNLLLIEDAAQAHGAVCDLGKAGSLSDAAAFSFYPSKNLGALGDGGAITTNNESLKASVRLLRNYGSRQKYRNDIIGFNSRLDDIQASFLSIKLKVLDTDNETRRTIAKAYIKGIKNEKIKLPFYNYSNNHVFYAFVVQVEDRRAFIEYLDSHNIESLIHYPIPPHKQGALSQFSHLNLPITNHLHNTVLSLPISPIMSEIEVQSVIDILNAY